MGETLKYCVLYTETAKRFNKRLNPCVTLDSRTRAGYNATDKKQYNHLNVARKLKHMFAFYEYDPSGIFEFKTKIYNK